MELLSPAGNLELALAAFDGGADAVYCGLSGAFNARMRAENFTFERLGKLLRFAHDNGKKVYVTFNTLVKEAELGSMFETLCELAKLRPDALIVQDPGVIHTVKKYFPELKLHASTQMGIHNSAGVQMMKNLGVERVILERQITLPELKTIAKKAQGIELELFVHGSLCCSLSGRCLLSGKLFNLSGNRGQCKQPCRRQYISGNQTGYFLSPGDLCGLSLLDEFNAYGVTSLKIEGRLRSPDYVWKTARAYRTLLAAAPGKQAEAFAEAEDILNTALSRRKTLGFYDFPSRTKLVDNTTSGAFGMEVGNVEKITRRGITVLTTAPLHLGDRLRFQPPQGGDGESFSLISMETALGKRALKVRAKTRIFIPGRFNASPQYRLLKIGENGFDYSRQAANLPSFRFPLDMEISFSAKKITLAVNGETFSNTCDFAPAEKHPLQIDAVQKCFSEALPEPWCAGDIKVKIDGKFFVPAAELKKLRREFWAQLTEKLTLDNYFSDMPQRMERFLRDTPTIPVPPQTDITTDSFIIPGFTGENELDCLKKKIAAAYDAGCRTFTVEHWHGFALLEKYSDVTVISRFPLPVTNSKSAMLLSQMQIKAAEFAPELTADDANILQSRSPIAVFQRKEPLPLLVSRIPLKTGKWRDRDGNSYTVDSHDGIYELFQ